MHYHKEFFFTQLFVCLGMERSPAELERWDGVYHRHLAYWKDHNVGVIPKSHEKKIHMEELDRQLEEYQGHYLGRQNGEYGVYGDGPHTARVVFIMNKPLYSESKTGRPFDWAGSLEFRHRVYQLIPPEQCYFMCIIPFTLTVYSGDFRIPPQYIKLTERETEHFMFYTKKRLEILSPRHIVAVGFQTKNLVYFSGNFKREREIEDPQPNQPSSILVLSKYQKIPFYVCAHPRSVYSVTYEKDPNFYSILDGIDQKKKKRDNKIPVASFLPAQTKGNGQGLTKPGEEIAKDWDLLFGTIMEKMNPSLKKREEKCAFDTLMPNRKKDPGEPKVIKREKVVVEKGDFFSVMMAASANESKRKKKRRKL